LKKKLAFSEYKRNKDKKKIKRITNDLSRKIIHKLLIISQLLKMNPIITDDDFENKFKGIIDDNNTEDNKQNDKYSPSFKLVSKRRK
jgi:hypothetical protein